MSDRARITNLTELIKDSKRLGFDKRLIRGFEKQREELMDKIIPCVFVTLDKSVMRAEEENKMAYILSVVGK